MCQRLLGNGRDYHEIDLIDHWLEIQTRVSCSGYIFYGLYNSLLRTLSSLVMAFNVIHPPMWPE